jgi:hypothetical protein
MIMRWLVLGTVSVMHVAAGWSIASCAPSSDCEEIGTCTPVAGGGGGDGGANPACVPSTNGAEPVDDMCGVFVSSSEGKDSNEGTKESPVATLAKAVELARAGSGRVYACAEMFAEALVVDGAVEIYGGLDCGGAWSYRGAEKTTLTAGPGEIPLRIRSGATGSRVEDFAIMAADATAPGGSSIAVIVEKASVELARCKLTAGMGADGEKGETPADPIGPSDPNAPAIKGASGAAACMSSGSGNPGGAGTINAICNTSSGGNGGKGAVAFGDSGSNGQPLPEPNPDGSGLGGGGETASGCKPGAQGANGAAGTPGEGAKELGTLAAAGYTGATGQDGTAGGTAQGGGGGGGAKGKVGCDGASGGGGGAGGCGGKGGLGGKAGGASIALVSLDADITYKDVVLRTAAGGKGGDGGDGQGGGVGGAGGDGGLGDTNPPATFKACSGGDGGQGGFGGKGGGGRGGHSMGIAFRGEAPSTDGVKIEIGAAGLGGVGAGAAGNGADGVAAQTQEFL